MKLSTRTRYGIRAVIELAKQGNSVPVRLKTIAQRQEISIKYLEQLMAILKSAGFVRSVRGARGGYVLARPAEQIRLDELFTALEGPLTAIECLDDASCCARAADCAARDIWKQVQDAVAKVLRAITIQDVVDKTKSTGLNYHI